MADIVAGLREALEKYLNSCPDIDGWKVFFYPRQPTMGFSTDTPAIYVGNPSMDSRPASLGYGMVDVTVRMPIHMYASKDDARQRMTKILRDFARSLVVNGCVTDAKFEYTTIISMSDRGKYHSRANIIVRVIAVDPELYCDPDELSC